MRRSASATVSGLATAGGSGGVLPSNRSTSAGAIPASRAISAVEAAHVYGANCADSGRNAAALACGRRRLAPKALDLAVRGLVLRHVLVQGAHQVEDDRGRDPHARDD